MKLTKYEQETIINFNEEAQTANVYTYNSRLRRKLTQLAEDRPTDATILDTDKGFGEFTVPKSWVKVSPPRTMSDEAKQKAADRMRALHEAKS